MPSRRRFLITSASVGASVGAGLAALPQVLAAPFRRRPERAFGISLAQWSLHKAHFAGEMTALDFPGVAREEFGLSAVEYVNAFLKDKATDFAWLEKLRAAARAADVQSLLIMIDGEGELGHPDDGARRQAVENHFKWVAAASFLGCHAIRVNAAGSGTADEQREHAADSLRRLGELADPYDVDVIVENHGGLSSDGAWLASTIQAAAHSRVGTLPDFGNFGLGDGTSYDRYQGVAELMPYARAVSAKAYDFDAQGEETTIDFHRMLKLVVDAGYRGHVGIEYEGSRLSEKAGIRATKALLERVRDELG